MIRPSTWEVARINLVPACSLLATAVIVLWGTSRPPGAPNPHILKMMYKPGEVEACRMVWAIALAAQSAAFLLAIATFGWALLKGAGSDSDQQRLAISSGVIVFIVIGYLLYDRLLQGPNLPSVLLTLAMVPDVAGPNATTVCWEAARMQFAQRSFNFIDVENILAAVVIIGGTLATGAVIVDLSQRDEWPADKHAQARALTCQIARFRLLLSVSAGALVVGVIQILTEFRWATSKLAGESAQAMAGLPSSIAVTAGGCFSLGLFAVFLTGAAILRNYVEAFTDKAFQPETDGPDRTEWQKKMGLSLPFANLYDFAKISLPLLTGLASIPLKS